MLVLPLVSLGWQQMSKLLICLRKHVGPAFDMPATMQHKALQVAQGQVNKGTHMQQHVFICRVKW